MKPLVRSLCFLALGLSLASVAPAQTRRIFDVQLNSGATMTGLAATGYGAGDAWNNLSLVGLTAPGPFLLSSGLTANTPTGSQASTVSLTYSATRSVTGATAYGIGSVSPSGQGANPVALMGQTRNISPANGSGYVILQFLFTGLVPNTVYTFYGYAMGNSSSGQVGEGGLWNTFAGITNSAPLTQLNTNLGVVGPTASDVTLTANKGISYVVMNAKTDASGNLFVQDGSYCGSRNSITFNAFINGFQLLEPPVNPVIITQPLAFGGSPGDTASFVVAVNTNVFTPMGAYWYDVIGGVTNLLADGPTGNGSTISGSGTTNLVFNSAQAADSGNIFCVLSNAYGMATSSVVQLLISSTPVAPIINFIQPTNATIIATTGSTNINVNAIGVPSPVYYWYDNASTLIQSGASPNLTLANLQLANAGTYSVTASNVAGTISSNFTINIIVTPTISSQPTNLLLNLGDPANFSVTASGVPTPSYQWFKNGTLIPGANATNYSIGSVAYTDKGTYSVLISNAAGTVTSAGAVLAVNSPMVGTPASPANGGLGICSDTPLYISFNLTPFIGITGKVRIFNTGNPSTPVDIIDMSLNNLNVQNRSLFPGDSQVFKYYPVIITGNTAAIYPHSGVLLAGQTYYVTIEPGVIVDSNGAYYTGITSSSTWQFSTKATGPADPANLVVAADGSGDFLTVQGAVDFVPLNNTSHVLINIRPGNYVEIVNVSSKNNITFRGSGRAVTTVGYPNNNNINGSTHIRMAFKVNANDIAVENLTVTNSTPQGGSQAEALMIEGNNSATAARRFICNNTTVSSLQDTILANINASQGYFYNSTVRGNFDFIWGGGNLFFTNCIIHTVTNTSGSTSYNLTASRTDFGTTSPTGNWMTPDGTKWSSNGFSLVSCTIEADPGVRGITMAGANGTAGGLASWSFCKIDTNAYIGPTAALSNTYNLWQYSNTDLAGHLITMSNLVTLGNADPRATAVTNSTIWLNGWVPQLLPNIVTNPASQSVSAGGSATFTSFATGIPDPTYQWLKNGSPIPLATGASYNIPSAVRTNAGNYAVVASNSSGSATSSVATLTYTGNFAPVASAATYTRQTGFSLKILIPGDLATHWSDADGDPVALSGAISTTNGASVSYDNSYVYYINPNNVTDEIDYTVSDGQGGTASGAIAINVNTAPSVSSAITISMPGNNVNVSFAGIPGYQYEIQRSTNLVNWLTIQTTNAPNNGLFNFTDTFPDLGGVPPPTAYYRTANP